MFGAFVAICGVLGGPSSIASCALCIGAALRSPRIDPEQEEPAATPAAADTTEAGATTSSAAPADAKASGLDVDAFAEKLGACRDQDSLDAAMDSLRALNPTDEQRAVLSDVYQRHAAELEAPASAPPAPAAAPTSRRARGTTPSID